jgi:cytochrome oxidase Cu insertion factor (SCO1/SenC/PrrC family)
MAHCRHAIDRRFVVTAPLHQDASPANDPPIEAQGSAVPYFLAFALLMAMLYGGWKWWQVRQFEQSRGQAIAGAIGPPLREFELTERSGEPLRSTDMRGRVWVATYFFTTCPGSCIRLNENIRYLHTLPELSEVTWVSITCDPDNDTLEVLRDYADRWQADPDRWLFCRAPLEYTQRVARGMNLFLSYKGHQDRVVVIDKSGKIRGMFDATSRRDCERLRTMLLDCLKEEPTHELASVPPP